MALRMEVIQFFDETNRSIVHRYPDSGSAEEEIACSYSADPIDVGFNSRYLLDIAGQFKGDTATFMLSDSGSPTILQDAADDRVLYVLMPMRV